MRLFTLAAILAMALMAACSAAPQRATPDGAPTGAPREPERPVSARGSGETSPIAAIPPSSNLAAQGGYPGPYVRGSADAPIAIDEYSDFQ